MPADRRSDRPATDTGSAITSDVASEIIEMVRCRLIQHGRADLVVIGFRRAFERIAETHPAGAEMRTVLATMLAEHALPKGGSDAH